MDTTGNCLNKLCETSDRMLVDLVFALASGECFREKCTYEEQLEYYVYKIFPDCLCMEEFFEYARMYRLASKYMFPNNPAGVKKRVYLIKLFSSFVVLRELKGFNRFDVISEKLTILDIIKNKYEFRDSDDAKIFLNEVLNLLEIYFIDISEDKYNYLIEKITEMEEKFENTYSCLVGYVFNSGNTEKKGSFASLLEIYNVSEDETTKFHLKLDATVETVVIKNEFLEYEDEFKNEWEKNFTDYKYSDELFEYVKTKKSAFLLSYGNKISSLKNESFLFMMLAFVTVKLAIADGAKNVDDLVNKIKDITSELGDNVKEIFIDSRKNVMRVYHLFNKEEYPAEWREILIPYRTDLMYLKDIIIEEIGIREAGSIVQKHYSKTKSSDEYELIISQKDKEIYELKRELEFYENIKQQEFKAEVSQYNKALADLFLKLCDLKYNSPLNELYLVATGSKESSMENVRGILKNMMFVFSSMNIVPYEVDNVGKKIQFYEEEANIVYSVDNSKLKEGLNHGIQEYPGWKYKNTELVLPKVDIEE